MSRFGSTAAQGLYTHIHLPLRYQTTFTCAAARASVSILLPSSIVDISLAVVRAFRASLSPHSSQIPTPPDSLAMRPHSYSHSVHSAAQPSIDLRLTYAHVVATSHCLSRLPAKHDSPARRAAKPLGLKPKRSGRFGCFADHAGPENVPRSACLTQLCRWSFLY